VSFLALGLSLAAAQQPIPSTLDGPFAPRTVAFDSSLRRGSSDLLPTDPRVAKTVVGDAPEQIALALSTPDAMWVTWITGNPSSALCSIPFLGPNLGLCAISQPHVLQAMLRWAPK
jgi:hypothetical protein